MRPARHPARRAAAALFALCAAVAAPVSAGEILEGDEVIGLEEWRAMTAGRVVHYLLGGRYWGAEYFHPDRDTSTFMTAQGECATAPWVHADGVFCFAYTGMDCFRHVRRGDQLLAVPLGGGETQVIDRITPGPLVCEPPLSS